MDSSDTHRGAVPQDGSSADRTALFHALIQPILGSGYALAFAMLMHPAEAEEIVAETFSYAWSAAAQFADLANRSVSGWLMEVARSRANGLLLARSWPGRGHAIKEFA